MTKIKNIMISEETHIKVIELKTKIYKETGQLLTMEKVIIYLLDKAKIQVLKGYFPSLSFLGSDFFCLGVEVIGDGNHFVKT